MNDLLSMIDGKKTYLAALGFLIVAAMQYQQKQYEAAAQSVLAALAAVGLRSAVDKAADKTADKIVNAPQNPPGGASPAP